MLRPPWSFPTLIGLSFDSLVEFVALPPLPNKCYVEPDCFMVLKVEPLCGPSCFSARVCECLRTLLFRRTLEERPAPPEPRLTPKMDEFFGIWSIPSSALDILPGVVSVLFLI